MRFPEIAEELWDARIWFHIALQFILSKRVLRELVCSQDPNISLVQLKQLSERKLPKESILRRLILSEPDSIPTESFLSKLAVWVNLFYDKPLN
jgi:hypothetical protein